MPGPLPILIGIAVIGVGALGARFVSRVVRNPQFKKIFSSSGRSAAANTAGKNFAEGTFLSDMTKKEAAQVLNVAETASEQDVKSAHRKLMLINHPDNGGSAFVSAKINEAKDILIGKIRKE